MPHTPDLLSMAKVQAKKCLSCKGHNCKTVKVACAVCFGDLSKLNWIWWFDFMQGPIFATAQAASKVQLILKVVKSDPKMMHVLPCLCFNHLFAL